MSWLLSFLPFFPCVLILLWWRFQPHILFCDSQKQQYSIIFDFSNRIKGHNLFGRERVTLRKIVDPGQTIKKLHKPLSALSCCSAGALLCWHSSCLRVLFIALFWWGGGRGWIIEKTELRQQTETIIYLSVEHLGKEGRNQ